MRRITHPREIGWFDIRKYDTLLNITLSELISQLEYRSWPFADVSYWREAWEEEACMEFITKGIVLHTPEYLIPDEAESFVECGHVEEQDTSLNKYADKKRLAWAQSIYPIDITTLMIVDHVAREKRFYKNDDDGEPMVAVKYAQSSLSAYDLEVLGNNIWAQIDLESFTDEQILSDLKILLPLWREDKGKAGPQPSEWRVGEGSFAKIINHRVIPLLDLLLWERCNRVRISNAVLAHVLSGEDIKGEEQIKKTMKPFLEVVSSDDFHIDLKYVLKANPGLEDRIVRNHLEMHSLQLKKG